MYGTTALRFLNTHQKQSLVYDYHMLSKSSIAIILTLLCLLYVSQSAPHLRLRWARFYWSPLQDTHIFGLFPASGSVKARSEHLLGNSEPNWVLYGLKFPFGPEDSHCQGNFFFSGIAQDRADRIRLICWFEGVQIVSLAGTPDTQNFCLAPMHLKGSLVSNEQTVYFNFKHANIFTGNADYYISLSLQVFHL